VTDAAAHDGRMLRRGLLDKSNTGPTVWADSAYRSTANETFIKRHGFKSQVHHRKPRGRPMASHIRRGNATRSKVRARIEHVFAHQKGPMALCIRTIGIVRAKVKIGLANLTYNIRRLVFLERRSGYRISTPGAKGHARALPCCTGACHLALRLIENRVNRGSQL